MANQDAMNAATFGFTGLFSVLGAVAQETDFEHAIALDGGVYQQIGQVQGRVMRDQVGLDGEADAETTFEVLRTVVDMLGIDYEIVASSPTRVQIKVGPCPVYNGAQNAGWEHEMICTSCHAGAVGFLDAAAKQFNPNLSWRLAEFRESAEGACVEELVLETS